jgi:hypothetical protein
MIKKWNKFSESISGWELVGKDMGPNYPEQKLPNSLDSSDTTVIQGIDGNLYTLDQFQDVYNLYLKMSGKENLSDFNRKNLDILLYFLEL